jgi:DNA end-binding protein Ku
MVGLGRVVLTRREHVVMLEAFDKGLLATTLRYAYEVRDQGAYFEDIPALKLPAEMIQLAGHIIDTKAGHFDPKKFEDHYETALVELLRKKQEGRAIEPRSGGRTRSSTRDQSQGRATRKHRRRDRKEAGGGQH